MKKCAFTYKDLQPCLTLKTNKFNYIKDFIENKPMNQKSHMIAHTIGCIDSRNNSININEDKCINCMFCVFSCPGNYIKINENYSLEPECSECQLKKCEAKDLSKETLIDLPKIKTLNPETKFKNFEDFTRIDEVKNISIWGAKVLEFLSNEDNPRVALEVGMNITNRNRGGRLDICTTNNDKIVVAEAKVSFQKMVEEDRYVSQMIAYNEELASILMNDNFYTFLLIGGSETDLLPSSHPKCTSNLGNRSKIFYKKLIKHNIHFVSANSLLNLGLMKLKYGDSYSLDFITKLLFSKNVVGILSSGIVKNLNGNAVIENLPNSLENDLNK